MACPSMADGGEPAAKEAPGDLAQPACSADHEQAGVARRFAEERLAIWQQRLDLDDWQISLLLTRREDLKPKTLGGIRWDKRKKQAVIWVLDPLDYPLPHEQMLEDMERTIVHELLHLELASRRRSEASRSHEEHAVNRIAEAFLKLDREK
ncbi:MAG: hypothetical protein WD733_15810 [Bryobacterales bacterium]